MIGRLIINDSLGGEGWAEAQSLSRAVSSTPEFSHDSLTMWSSNTTPMPSHTKLPEASMKPRMANPTHMGDKKKSTYLMVEWLFRELQHFLTGHWRKWDNDREENGRRKTKVSGVVLVSLCGMSCSHRFPHAALQHSDFHIILLF